MMSGHGTVETAVEATRLGAFDYVEKPLSLQKLLRTVERALEAGKRKRHAGKLLAASPGVPVGRSRVMQQLRADLAQIAGNDSPVLLVGETGTGREAFARFIHDASPRAARPFVMLISSTLRGDGAEQVLFGTEADGQAAPGVLERAGAGTLFVNELEDLPLHAQRALLGALESGQFTRVGGSSPVTFKARLLSSARPGIETRNEEFRRDLLAHLNTLIVRVPPLREYTEDVPDLLRHYVDRLVDGEALPFRKFSVAAQNRLRNYPWPDNVRELKNLVQRLLLQGGGEEIRLEEIERELAAQAPTAEPLVKQDLLSLPLREAREQFERAYLQQQLLLCNGKVGQLAKRVGMERTHLYRKLRSLGVDFRNITDEAE
jgi:DNA-binding NtrC family response regulator